LCLEFRLPAAFHGLSCCRLAPRRPLKDAVEIEVDQYIPIPAATLYIDSEIIERDKKNITVLMGAMSRSIVDNCVKAVESADLQVVLVEPGMNAVGRLLTSTEDGHLPTVIVDIGPASTDIAILEKGSIRVTGGLAIGGNTFTLDIAKKLGVTLENAHQLKVLSGLNAGSRQEKIKSALDPSLERIVIETRKVIRYYKLSVVVVTYLVSANILLMRS
jgi:type IV pilus assembly protein PilM